MEITRSNFREKLPEITSDINRSVFIAFDQEFTGLSNAETRNPYATLEEVYSNKLRTAEGFIVIQFGLTCFFFDDPAGGTGDRLSYRSYNFYVSPRRRRSVFLCESDAMSFLSRNNFDFNKLFREGISFCTIPEEETLREQLKERQSKRADVMVSGEADTGNHILVPEKEEPLVQGIIEQIEEYLQGPAENELQLKGLNGFQRRLIYQTIETKFFQKVTAVTDQNVMLVKKMASPEDVKREEEERCVKEAADLEDQVGMTMLMKVLSDSRKLIVGHNIYHDLFYLVRQFFRPLPEDYSGFKSLLHELFPFLLDTKYLCCTHDQLKELIPSSVLGDVFRDIRKEPFDLPEFLPAGSEYGYAFEDDDKAHEAGWDALICGICFVGMARKLGVGLESPLEKNALLKPFINRIFVMGVSDVKCINLGGKDPAPKRDHVFHVTFPATWKRIDITNRFKDFGGCQVYRLSDTTAFIGLIQPEFSSAVWKSLKSSPEMKIQRYLEYTKPSIDVGQDSPLTTVVKRKLADSSSPMDGSKKTKSNKSPNFPTNDNWTK